MQLKINKLVIIIIGLGVLAFGVNMSLPSTQNEMLAVVEQNAGHISFYNPANNENLGTVKVGYLPHEVIVSQDYKTAYVSNFGIQDYNENIGIPGTSISVIDIPSRTEKFRLFTFDEIKPDNFSAIDKAPHGMRLRPPLEKELYVNVERGDQLLVYNLYTKKMIKKIPINRHVHNMLFSPDGKILWLMAGADGIIKIDPDNGKILGNFRLSTPSRGLTYTPDNQYLMVSGMDEIALVDPISLKIFKHFKKLDAGQLLYSAISPDQKLIVAPAVWNSQAIIINTDSGKVIQRIVTGLDPVTVKISSSGQFAYVTNARSNYVTQIDLKNFKSKNIFTKDGPNGIAIIPLSKPQTHNVLRLGVPLPLSGKNSSNGRNMMLGYEFWRLQIEQAGGLFIHGKAYDVNIVYLDTQSNDKTIESLTSTLITKYKINILLPTYGSHEYELEKNIADKADTLLMPLSSHQEILRSDLASGYDYFVTFNAYDKQFQNYYNVKVESLSAMATATVIKLQQTLLKADSLNLKLLQNQISNSDFHIFTN